MKRLLLSLLLVLGLCGPAFAVTEFISTINKTGQDYDTLTLWEAATDDAGDLTDGTVKCGAYDGKVGSNIADATAVTWDGGSSGGTLIHQTATQYLIKVTTGTLADDDVVTDSTNSLTIQGAPDSCIITAHLYNDDGTLDDRVVLSGVTSDATNYRKISVPVAERHDGTEGSGSVIDPSTDGSVVTIEERGAIVEWLEIKGWGGNNSAAIQIASVSASGYGRNVIVRNNILHDSDGGNPQHGVYEGSYYGDNQAIVANNIVYDVAGKCFTCTESCNGYLINNTCTGSAHETCAFTMQTKGLNNISMGNTGADFCTYTGSSDLDYNLSEDTSAEGTNSLVSQTYADEFVNAETDGTADRRLKTGANSIDEGSNQSALGGRVQYDIENEERTGTWDIGADEFVAEVSCDTDCTECATFATCKASASSCSWFDKACSETAGTFKTEIK